MACGRGVLIWEDEKVLDVNGGDGGPTVWLSLVALYPQKR